MSSHTGQALIGSSKAMECLRKSIQKAAKSDMTVLIQGETGTGKELVARAIHKQSSRSDRSFIATNCASVQESLVESELFGHEKGAFTGADTMKKGKFELADTGTLFLDEIGEIGPAVQSKLLRVLQEHEIERVGGQRPIPIDFRLIAATNRELEEMVAAGTFREDLYFRLYVDLIRTPPLRDRPEDIVELAHHFMRRYGHSELPMEEAAAPEVLNLFRNYSWPGNVREFENIMQRAIRESDGGAIGRDDLPREFYRKAVRSKTGPQSYHKAMNELSRNLCLWALEAAGGNGPKAADLLDMNRTTFRRIIKKNGLADRLDL